MLPVKATNPKNSTALKLDGLHILSLILEDQSEEYEKQNSLSLSHSKVLT